MSVGTGLANFLITNSSINSISGDRVYPQHILQQDRIYPAIEYAITDESSDVAHDGTTGFRTCTAHIACMALTEDDANALGEAVRDQLDASGPFTWGDTDIQGIFLQEDGVSDGIETEPDTESILYYFKLCIFHICYS